MSELENERLHLKQVLQQLDERKQFVVDKLESVKRMSDLDMAKTVNEIYDREYFNIKNIIVHHTLLRLFIKTIKKRQMMLCTLERLGFKINSAMKL